MEENKTFQPAIVEKKRIFISYQKLIVCCAACVYLGWSTRQIVYLSYRVQLLHSDIQRLSSPQVRAFKTSSGYQHETVMEVDPGFQEQDSPPEAVTALFRTKRSADAKCKCLCKKKKNKCRGPRGFKGPRGKRGFKGKPGPKGESGSRGLPGQKGTTGQRGSPGPRGTPGDIGQKGEPGTPGQRGPYGPPGQNGFEGPKGPKGDRGGLGEQGLPGQKGFAGQPGERGPKGFSGNNGGKGAQGPRGAKGRPAVLNMAAHFESPDLCSFSPAQQQEIMEGTYHRGRSPCFYESKFKKKAIRFLNVTKLPTHIHSPLEHHSDDGRYEVLREGLYLLYMNIQAAVYTAYYDVILYINSEKGLECIVSNDNPSKDFSLSRLQRSRYKTCSTVGIFYLYEGQFLSVQVPKGNQFVRIPTTSFGAWLLSPKV